MYLPLFVFVFLFIVIAATATGPANSIITIAIGHCVDSTSGNANHIDGRQSTGEYRSISIKSIKKKSSVRIQFINMWKFPISKKKKKKIESAECDAHAKYGSNSANVARSSGNIASGICIAVDWRWNGVHNIRHTIECNDIIVASAAHCHGARHPGDSIQPNGRRQNSFGRCIGEWFDRTKCHTHTNPSEPIAAIDGRQSASVRSGKR